MNGSNAVIPLETAARRIFAARQPLLVTHHHPDGDAIGSIMGLAAALRKAGRTPAVLLPGGIPSQYAVRPAEFVEKIPDYSGFDLVILLDTAVPERAGFTTGGGVPEAVQSRLLVLDHHPDNPLYGAENCVKRVAATAMLAAQVVRLAGVPLDPEAAEWFLLGHYTDTGSFRFDNTNGEALRSAAALVDAGASVNRIANRAFFSKPLAQQQFEAALISECLHLAFNGRFAYAVVKPGLAERFGLDLTNVEGIIDVLREIDGTVIVAFIYRRDQAFRVSLRSKDPRFPVKVLANRYGGGGHALAAGMTLADRRIDEIGALLEREVATLLEHPQTDPE